MPSPSCQQNPRPPAGPALIADLALPAVPVVREYLLNTSFIAARVRLVSLISDGSLIAASIEAYASSLLKLAGRATGGVEVTISPVELSARVGLDVEAVKRTVQRLRDRQYVRITGERIEIPDVEALRRLYTLLGAKDDLAGPETP